MDFVHPFVRGGLDEKMRRMWLGLEIVVVGLPPLDQGRKSFPYLFTEMLVIVVHSACKLFKIKGILIFTELEVA